MGNSADPDQLASSEGLGLMYYQKVKAHSDWPMPLYIYLGWSDGCCVFVFFISQFMNYPK